MLKIFSIILYILAFFIDDEFRLVPMLGVLAAYIIMNPPAEKKAADSVQLQLSSTGIHATRNLIYVSLFICLEFFASYFLRIFHREIFNIGSFGLFGIELVNSFVVLVELAFVFLYYIFLHKERILRTNTRTLVFCFVMLLPFVVRDSFSAIYDLFSINTRLNALDYINLSYRALILAAFVEELIYRGMIFSELRVHFKPTTAAIIQAGIFTLVHSERWLLLLRSFDLAVLSNLFAVFLLGLLAAFLQRRTKSLLPCILMHFALNGGIYDLLIPIIQLFI